MPLLAQAWNATGHRLTADIAWQQLSAASRQQITALLALHPDYPRWVEKARSTETRAIFAEAATWPDDIRRDPRFHDERREAPTPAIPGLPDSARHLTWHYVDLADDGRVQAGEIEQQIERLSQLLRAGDSAAEMAWALPWLLHLVGDIHQPLHVGRHEDEGGNRFEIENPLSRRQPFSNLHRYWDELPGTTAWRGKRLQKATDDLLARYPAPVQGSVRRWRDESHRLLSVAYPPATGSLLPTVTEEFQQQTQDIANRRLVDAGYRLGRLLNDLLARGVPRGTP